MKRFSLELSLKLFHYASFCYQAAHHTEIVAYEKNTISN